MNDLEIAITVAKAASELLMKTRSENIELINTRELGDIADKAAETLIAEQLKHYRPTDAILSEEALDDLNRLTAQRVWIVDPLDGTNEYSSNRDDFAVHIALWERADETNLSKISTAVVALPATGQIFDSGSKQKLEEFTGVPRVVISRTRPPETMSPILDALKNRYGSVETLPLGSVGAKVAQLIIGKADVYVHTTGFYEWDVAAPLGVAVARGFHASDIFNKSIVLNKENNRVENLLICHPDLTETLIAALR
jgi:3'(2'), 5'-bisphosphate nucleotidase